MLLILRAIAYSIVVLLAFSSQARAGGADTGEEAASLAESNAVVSLVVGDDQSRRVAWAKHCKTKLAIKDSKWFPCAANAFLFGGTPEKLFSALPRQPAEFKS